MGAKNEAFEERNAEALGFSRAKVVGNVIQGVSVLGHKSPNGKKGRKYPKQYHESAKRHLEGIAVTLNHPKEGEDRRVEDRIGVLRGIETIEEDGQPKTRAKEFVVNPEHPRAKQILWAAENQPESLGMSVDNLNRWKEDPKTGEAIAQECIKSYGVDLVAQPATNKGLFESEQLPKAKGKKTVEWNEISLEQLRANRPELVKSLEAEGEKRAQESEEHKKKAALAAEERKELETLRAEKESQKKKDECRKACESAGLKDPSDIFLKVLVNSSPEDRAALIEERKSLAPASEGKEDKKEKPKNSEIKSSGKSQTGLSPEGEKAKEGAPRNTKADPKLSDFPDDETGDKRFVESLRRR